MNEALSRGAEGGKGIKGPAQISWTHSASLTHTRGGRQEAGVCV